MAKFWINNVIFRGVGINNLFYRSYKFS